MFFFLLSLMIDSSSCSPSVPTSVIMRITPFLGMWSMVLRIPGEKIHAPGLDSPAYAGSGSEPPPRYLSLLRFLFSISGSPVFALNFALLAKLVSTHFGISVPLSTSFEIIFSTTVLPSTDIELKRLLSRRSQFPNDVVPEHKKLLQKLQCLNVLNTHPLFSDLEHSCQYILTKTVNWSQFNWTTFNWFPNFLLLPNMR